MAHRDEQPQLPSDSTDQKTSLQPAQPTKSPASPIPENASTLPENHHPDVASPSHPPFDLRHSLQHTNGQTHEHSEKKPVTESPQLANKSRQPDQHELNAPRPHSHRERKTSQEPYQNSYPSRSNKHHQNPHVPNPPLSDGHGHSPHSDDRRRSRERYRRRRRHYPDSDDFDEEREYRRRRRRRRRRRSYSPSESPKRTPSEQREREMRRRDRRQRRRERDLLREEERRDRKRHRREPDAIPEDADQVQPVHDGKSPKRSSLADSDRERMRDERRRRRSRDRDDDASGDGRHRRRHTEEHRYRRRRQSRDRGSLDEDKRDDHRNRKSADYAKVAETANGLPDGKDADDHVQRKRGSRERETSLVNGEDDGDYERRRRRRARRRERDDYERRRRDRNDFPDGDPDGHHKRSRHSRSPDAYVRHRSRGDRERELPRDELSRNAPERNDSIPIRRGDAVREERDVGRNYRGRSSMHDMYERHGGGPREERRLRRSRSPNGAGMQTAMDREPTRLEGKSGVPASKVETSENIGVPNSAGVSRDGILSRGNSNSAELKAKLSALKRDHLRAKVLASIGKKGSVKGEDEDQS